MLEAAFGRGAVLQVGVHRNYVVAGAIVVVGWICLLARLSLSVPGLPSQGAGVLVRYSEFVGPILLFYAAFVASRPETNQQSIAKGRTVLLLRPFQEDTDSTGLFAPSFETHLSKVFSPRLSLVAVKAQERLETFGASHVAYSNETWQAGVFRMMHEAALIVLCLGDSPGVQWEIRMVLARLFYSKTVFFVQEPKVLEKDWWSSLTSAFSGTIWAEAIAELDEVAQLVRAFSLRPDGSVRVIYIGEQSHRSRTIGVVLAASDLIPGLGYMKKPLAQATH